MFAEDINVNQLAVEIAKQSAILNGMAKDVGDMSKIITGNGDPSAGMVVRQVEMQNSIDVLQKGVTKVTVDLEEFKKVSPGIKGNSTNFFMRNLDKFIPPHIRSMFWLILIRSLAIGFGVHWLADLIPIK